MKTLMGKTTQEMTDFLSEKGHIIKDVRLCITGIKGFTVLIAEELIKRNLHPDFPNFRILEVGCGTGKLGYFFSQFGAIYTGVDINPEQIRYAWRLKKIADDITGLGTYSNYVVEDAHALPKYWKDCHDVVFSEGVIEHFKGKERQDIVNEMARVSRNLVMIFVPNSDNPKSQKVSKRTKHDYRGMGEKEYLMNRADLYDNLSKAGLKDIHIVAFENILFGAGVIK